MRAPRLFGLLLLAACAGGDDDDVREQPSAISSRCTSPPDCLPIVSLINIDVCCSEQLRCGFDLTAIVETAPMYPEIAEVFEVDPDKPCWPRSRIFLPLPETEPQRVSGEGGADVLITPSCQGRLFTATPLAGCCLPDNTCGYDTHLARNTFRELAGLSDGAFEQPQCLSASELNTQLAAHELAAWAYIPPSSGSCDYARLDAEL